MLSSLAEVQEQISLRNRVIELRRAALGRQLVPDDGWDYYEDQRDRRELAALGQRLTDLTGDLVWTIDGKGVYGNSVTMGQLETFSRPLRGLLRWTQRDLVVVQGPPLTDAKMWQLVEPVVAGTVDGSFGLRLTRPPLTEIMDLFSAGTLFEQAAKRIAEIFATAGDSVSGAEVAGTFAGLRSNTRSHLFTLSTAVIESGGTSEVQWQGGEPIPVTSSVAATVIRELQSNPPDPEELTVVGLLDGGAVKGRSFILIADTDEDADKPPARYRGRVSAEVASLLPALHFEERVVATLTVTYTDSPKTLEPKRTYTLTKVQPIGRPDGETS